jgi:RHS repeat-associated protein
MVAILFCNLLSTYRHQLRYRQVRVLEEVLTTLRTVPGFSDGLGTVLGTDGGFSSTLIGGLMDTDPGYVTTQVENKEVLYYVQKNNQARAALLTESSELVSSMADADSPFRALLLPPDVYYGQLFGPLALGISDHGTLYNYAALLLENPGLQSRFVTYMGLDPEGEYEHAMLSDLLVSKIEEWREAHESAERIEDIIWQASGPQDLYMDAVHRLLPDAGYLQASVVPEADGEIISLESQLKIVLQTKTQGTDHGLLQDKVNTYLGTHYEGMAGIELLRGYVGDESLLGTIYADSPANFIEGVLAGPQFTEVLLNAMNGASSLTALDIVSRLDGIDDAFHIPLTQVIDYDQLHLSEQVLYGSSRLGVKRYWPTQYRYEYDITKTTAQNNASLDSSAFSHRAPWYSQGYQSMIKGLTLQPYGQGNTDAIYSSRVLGQKRYELSNHLGNVMAVVSDKVTENRVDEHAPLPALAVKRASLSAAYDYYPFGMLMPERMVEDTSVQCIPLSRTRMVKVVSTNGPTSSSNDFLSLFVAPPGTELHYDPGGDQLTLMNPDGDLDLLMPLPAPESGAAGIHVGMDMTTHSDNHLLVQLLQVGAPEDAAPLAQQLIAGAGRVDLTADFGAGTSSSNQFQLRISGFANTLELMNTWYDVVHLQAQSYVTLSCDTDGRFDDSYRFGFNGQMKDNEIAGIGNSLDFGARMYNPRLGIWNSPDKVVKPNLSAYQFGRGNPITFIDPDGNTEYYFNGIWVASDGQKNNAIGLIKSETVKTQMESKTYKFPTVVANGYNSNDIYAMDASILKASNQVLSKSLTKEGETTEYGTRFNKNASGKYVGILQGIVKGVKASPNDQIATVNIPGKGGVTIHSHPTGTSINPKTGGIRSHSASNPGPGDFLDKTEEQIIIVGKHGDAEGRYDISGESRVLTIIDRLNEINVFNQSNKETPIITIPQAQSIISDYSKRTAPAAAPTPAAAPKSKPTTGR